MIPEFWNIVSDDEEIKEGDRFSLDNYRILGRPVWRKVNPFHITWKPRDIPGITFIRKHYEPDYQI